MAGYCLLAKPKRCRSIRIGHPKHSCVCEMYLHDEPYYMTVTHFELLQESKNDTYERIYSRRCCERSNRFCSHVSSALTDSRNIATEFPARYGTLLGLDIRIHSLHVSYQEPKNDDSASSDNNVAGPPVSATFARCSQR